MHLVVRLLFNKNSKVCLKHWRFKHTNVQPLFVKMKTFYNKIAIHDRNGSHKYGDIFVSAINLSKVISEKLDGRKQERVLFLCSNDVNYVVTLWAIWMSGQIGKR